MRQLGLGTLLGLLLLGYVLMQVTVLVFVGIAMTARGIGYASAVRMVTSDPLPLGAAQLAALGAVLAFGLYLGAPGRTPQRVLGLSGASPRVVLTAALAGLALQLPFVEIVTLLTRVIPQLAHSPDVDAHADAIVRIDSPLRAITVPFAIVIVAPVTEELLFRGLVQRALRDRFGPRAAIVLASLLFGAYHGDLQALVYASAIGVVLGIVAERSGSTMPGIAMHAGFNAMPVLFPAELVHIAGFNDHSPSDVPWPWLLGSTSIAIVALVSLAFFVRREPPADQTS